MGDVALCLPVLRALLDANPELTILFATHHRLTPLFANIPRLQLYPVNTAKAHQGIFGMARLARELRGHQSAPFDAFIDLHNVTRSHMLSAFMKMRSPSMPVYRYDKGRAAKAKLTRKENKIFTELPHTTRRYLDAFGALSLEIPEHLSQGIELVRTKPKNREKKIGIAPLSAHMLKEYPPEQMRKLVDLIEKRHKAHFFLLGGPGEKEKLNAIFAGLKVENMAGAHASMEEELALISGLDLVITMDSANLHIATLLGIPTLSIWGPTHPFAGFAPLHLQGGPEPVMAQRDDLPCRPCSIYGNRPCHRGDHACMTGLPPEEISALAEKILQKRS